MNDFSKTHHEEDPPELGSSLADAYAGEEEAPQAPPKESPVEDGYQYTNSRGKTYFLHGRETTLKNGLQRTLYFFAKDPRPGVMDSVPDGYQVAETKTGLPVLKKV